jgi:DNA-binding XRE family transcriptional regulator
MGQEDKLTVVIAPARRGSLPDLSPEIKRTRPRDYVEWKTLRRWGKLPSWEGVFPGYLLREAREEAGLTVSQMAERLGMSQPEIAEIEEPQSKPTASLLKAWAEALGRQLNSLPKDIRPGSV